MKKFLFSILTLKGFIVGCILTLVYFALAIMNLNAKFPESEIIRFEGNCPNIQTTFQVASNDTRSVNLREYPNHPDAFPKAVATKAVFGSSARVVSDKNGDHCINPSLINSFGDWWVYVETHDGRGWVMVKLLATAIN